MSVDAFVDSMIWGGMNSVEPPYAIHITNIGGAPKEVADDVVRMICAIEEGRRERFRQRSENIEVSISAA